MSRSILGQNSGGVNRKTRRHFFADMKHRKKLTLPFSSYFGYTVGKTRNRRFFPMQQLFLLAAVICFGMAAIKFYTARMKPNTAPPQPPKHSTDLTAEEAKARMDENPELILLDVRTQEAFDESHIPGAVCLPVEMIVADMPFPFGKDAEILVYCQTGHRSADAASRLRELGFTDVSDIGGIIDWPYETTTD